MKKYIGPVHVNKHAWYYVEPNGLSYVQEEYRETHYVRTNVVTIPWRVLKKVLAQKERS